MGFGFVLLVIYLSLTRDRPNFGFPQGIKIGHVLAYTWLMLWYSQLYARTRVRLLFAAAFCLMGVALEYLQGMTDYRTFAYTDMLLNAGGVGIGSLLGRTRLQHALDAVEGFFPRGALPGP